MTSSFSISFQDHHLLQNPSSCSLGSVRVYLTLMLLVTHHCSTTWSAAVADREEHRRWMTFGSSASTEAPPAFTFFTTSSTTTNNNNKTETANSTSTNSSSTQSSTLTTPPPLTIAPGVQADHASGDLSLEPSANHQVTLEAQNSILSAAEAVSLDLTHRLISPIVWMNNRVSQAAGTLPALMAANGALLGTAIAVPIQSTALAANHLAAAGAGTLVTVPISVVSGGSAGLLGAIESAREFYHASVRPTLHYAYEALPGSPIPVLIRPVAMLGGASSVVGGMALGVVSSSVHSVAEGVERLGDQLEGAGQGIAQWGDQLVLWSLAGDQQEQQKKLNQTQQVNQDQTPKQQ